MTFKVLWSSGGLHGTREVFMSLQGFISHQVSQEVDQLLISWNLSHDHIGYFIGNGSIVTDLYSPAEITTLEDLGFYFKPGSRLVRFGSVEPEHYYSSTRGWCPDRGNYLLRKFINSECSLEVLCELLHRWNSYRTTSQELLYVFRTTQPILPTSPKEESTSPIAL